MGDTAVVKVFTYIRVSSAGQISGDGPERQRDEISKFCTAHELKFTGEFRELGVSGTVEGIDRPELSELFKYVDVRAGSDQAVGAVVVERLDRLARDLMVSELILSEFRQRGIKVFSTDQGALIDMASDSGDPTRTLIRQIMGALAQWEKTMLVKKLRAARERIRAKTGRCEGPKRYGQTQPEKNLIATILNLHSLEMSLPKLAKLLNEQGIFNRRGRPWEKSTLSKFITRHRKNLCAEPTSNI